MSSKKTSYFIFLLVLSLLVYSLLFLRSRYLARLELNSTPPNFEEEYSSGCDLPNYDYLDPSIMDLMDGFDPTKKCDKNFQPFTNLENGIWRISKTNANCSARCFEGVGNGKTIKFENWTKPGPVKCEFLEAVCWEDGVEVYGHIHTQIIPKIKTKNRIDKPNVFVFLMDSMSVGMAKRSFSDTTAYLVDTFGAVEFPYVNKVGENSKANGFAVWFGKRIEGENLTVDWSYDEYCNRYLDNETHIFKEFMARGYKTSLMEDYARVLIDSWPFCKGFETKQVDHDIRPVFIANEQNSRYMTMTHLDGSLCKLPHHVLIEYFQQFLDAYQGHPMFKFMWPAKLAHDHLDGLRVADKDFLKMFKQNQKLFDDSYVIMMGDHGYRLALTNFSDSKVGSLEKNNPYLSISVPRKLRNENLLSTMRENAKRLQTHFDTRASLLDILKYRPGREFGTLRIPGEKGHSLFRRQPSSPRNCQTLPIPNDYCICQHKEVQVNDPITNQRLGESLVDYINNMLKTGNVSEMCVKQKFSSTTNLIKYPNLDLYKIAVKTKEPGSIHVETLVREGPDGTDFGQLTRLDTYGTTNNCTIRIKEQKMCYCKDHLL